MPLMPACAPPAVVLLQGPKHIRDEWSRRAVLSEDASSEDPKSCGLGGR